jgi:hypothetical protein
MLGAMELFLALGRDDLRVVRYRCGSVHRIIRSWGIPYPHVVFKLPVVDTEVDPPQQIKACAWAFKLRQSRAIVCF